MKIDFVVRNHGPWVVVELSGRITAIADAGVLRQYLESLALKGTSQFVLDCTRVSYIESNFLTVVLKLKKVAEKNGGELVLIHSDLVKETLETTGLPDVLRTFDSFESFEDAVGS